MTMSSMFAATTSLSGVVVDAETGETLPLVQIYFEGTTIGTTSDMDGNFRISNDKGYTMVTFQMMGYKTEEVVLRVGQSKSNQRIEMQTNVYGLEDIVVTPKNKKPRYKRKNNPAIDLMRQVIAHKDSGNVSEVDHYSVKSYDKMIMALDNFRFNFNKSIFWKQFLFVEKYIDTTKLGGTPMLTIDVRENMIDHYRQRKPQREKMVVTAKRTLGIEDMISSKEMDANLKAIFAEVNIYDDNMDLLLNRFVSPLSSKLAISYYQYYIQDTLLMEGEQCIDVAFVPVNSESYSFTGHLYILNDGTYKLKRYTMNIPPHINLNFVRDYSIEQSFHQLDNGLWVPGQADVFAKFYLFKKKKDIYTHQQKIYYDYKFEGDYSDSVFTSLFGKDQLIDTVERKLPEVWRQIRPFPLSWSEVALDTMIAEFRSIPKFYAIVNTADALTTGYIPTSKTLHKSKFDIGHVYHFISWNKLEGVRLRFGGTTTANLNPHFFAGGYVAFGIDDLRPKYKAVLTYSFNSKKYHPYESLTHGFQLSSQYDVEQPGQSYQTYERDYILMSIPSSKPTVGRVQYVERTKLTYQKEWPCQFSIKTWAEFEHNEAAGLLKQSITDISTGKTREGYLRIKNPTFNAENQLIGYDMEAIPKYFNYTFGLEFKYAPGAPAAVDRMGKMTAFCMDKDAPVFLLTHKVGYLTADHSTPFGDMQNGNSFFYQTTEFSAEKRFWFSSFGHLDLKLQAGIVWNKVPYTQLCIPPGNKSIFLTLNAFNMMDPMEFVMDKYVSLFATYYLKGWILNRIPGINRLKLREIVSFSGIYGGLSQKNNPAYGGDGLYLFPEGTSAIGKLPYLECSVGLENILKVIRVDYVRRLTYTQGLGPWQKNGIKVTIRFAL